MSPANKYIKPNYDLINRNLPFHGIATLARPTSGNGRISCTVKPPRGFSVKPHQLLLFKQPPWAGGKASWGISTTNSPTLKVRAGKKPQRCRCHLRSLSVFPPPRSCFLLSMWKDALSYNYCSDIQTALNLHHSVCVCARMCPPSHSLSRWRKQTCFISLPMARCY